MKLDTIDMTQQLNIFVNPSVITSIETLKSGPDLSKFQVTIKGFSNFKWSINNNLFTLSAYWEAICTSILGNTDFVNNIKIKSSVIKTGTVDNPIISVEVLKCFIDYMRLIENDVERILKQYK